MFARLRCVPADKYMARNCSRPSMDTALLEKLHRTYMLAAMWKKEKWLKVESSIGEQSVSVGNGESLSQPDDGKVSSSVGLSLTGGGVSCEVFYHGALQRRHSPAAEHNGVSSNDPCEENT